jgi:predicted nucleotidyltransferase
MGIFGSILGSHFRPNSDIDILLQFAPTARQGLLTLAKIKVELETRFNRAVDLSTWEGIENSDNWIRRQSILDTAILTLRTHKCGGLLTKPTKGLSKGLSIPLY